MIIYGCARVNPLASGGAGKRTPGHVRLQRHRDAGGLEVKVVPNKRTDGNGDGNNGYMMVLMNGD